MKKLFISILAVAALASCTKSDVIYDEPSEIGFVPATKMVTKAVAAVSSTDYPDALNMYVFAMAGTDGTGFTEPYFVNAEFTHRTDLATNIFGGKTPYYWPNVKKLIFSGYSKSGNVASLLTGTDPTSYTTADGISIVGYAPGYGTDLSGDNDLMWFPTTTSYGKQDNAIDVTMKHACSWITIKIKGNDVTGVSGTSWKIHKLQLSSVSKVGNVTLGTNAVWSDLESPSTEDVFASANADERISLTTDFVDYTDGSITQEKYSDLVVIPQKACTLHITYSYSPSTGITIEETVPVSLNFEAEVNANSNKWAPGKHYVYEITIGTSEILIDPSADVWILHS